MADALEFARVDNVLKQGAAPLLARRANGKTLLIGWSPTLKLTPPQADPMVVVDFSLSSLQHVPERTNVLKARAAAGALPFDRGIFDSVFMINLLHHLAEDSTVETDRMMRGILQDTARVMRRSSKLFILEPLVSPFIETLNRIFYFPLRILFNARKIPMICFYSLPNLKEALSEAGLELVYSTPVGFDAPIPISWFFPNIRMNAQWMPQKITLLEIKKKA
jgi:hypothetical protein